VWDLMSEVFEKDRPEYFACLCKSLSCGAPAKFTINVKEKLAGVFEKRGMFAEAKREYTDILEARRAEGWKMADKHDNWQKLSWWGKTKVTVSNFDIYNRNKDAAEKLLYADKPETLIVVDTVNTEKTVFSFVASKQLHGFIHYGRLNITPASGDILAVRFMEQDKENKSNFFRVHTIHKTGKTPPETILRTVTGSLNIRQGNSFGFIDNVYVPANVIKDHNLHDGETVNIITILSYNRKKKEWGWKAVKLL